MYLKKFFILLLFIFTTTFIANSNAYSSGLYLMGGYAKEATLTAKGRAEESADCYNVDIGGRLTAFTLAGGYNYCSGLKFYRHRGNISILMQGEIMRESTIGVKPYVGGGLTYSYLNGKFGNEDLYGAGVQVKAGLKVNIKFIVLSVDTAAGFSLLESTLNNAVYGEFHALIGGRLGFVF